MKSAKAMLDALMGPSRDVSAKDKGVDWKERTVCKKFLIGFCPYDKSCLGGRRSMEPCPKIHNEILRGTFEAHEDGKEGSEFRISCEEIAIRDLQDCLAERDAFARKQIDQLKAETKIRRLPDEVNARISQMKREATLMKDRAGALDDCDGRQKEQLLQDAETMLADMEAYMRDEEKKAQLAQPVPKTCEICGTGWKTDEDYQHHLTYKAHSAYQEVVDFLQKLKDKKAERQAKKEEAAKKKREAEEAKEAERKAEKEKRRAEREKEKEEKKKEKKDKEKDDDDDDKEKDKDKDKDKEKDKDDDKEEDKEKKKDKDGKSRSGSRSKSKKKSRSKDRKSRSRDRKKGRRDGSRKRDRSRSRRRDKDRSRGRGGGSDGITRVSKKDMEKWDRSDSRGKKKRDRSKSKRRKSRSRSRRRR